MANSQSEQIARVATLDEPTRRKLYEYVMSTRTRVSREEAAAAVGVTRATAAFHLDKLAAEDLLEVSHERLSGRTGPGAGRPAKLYRRPTRGVEVSLPRRRYDLAGALLAAAVEDAERTGRSVREAIADSACDAGRDMARASSSDDPVAVLDENGFEPRTDCGLVRLGNCPFHELAARHTELVCGMNLHLVDGMLEGVSSTTYVARLAPSPDNCCVVLSADIDD